MSLVGEVVPEVGGGVGEDCELEESVAEAEDEDEFEDTVTGD